MAHKQLPREHGQQGLVSVAAWIRVRSNCSSYVRPSPYVSAEEGEEEGEAKIAIFFPGISLKNKTGNLSLYQLALQRKSLKMKGVKRLPGRVPETTTPGSVNCSLHSQRMLTKARSV